MLKYQPILTYLQFQLLLQFHYQCKVSPSDDSTLLFQLRSLFHCQCQVCDECLSEGFEVMIRNNHVRELVCLVCREPDIQNVEQAETHFQFMEMLVGWPYKVLLIDWLYNYSQL